MKRARAVPWRRVGKRKPAPIAPRFWSRVRKTDGCWLWTGGTCTAGYGRISRSGAEGPIYTHRLAWQLQVGPIPPGMEVLHGCDNPPCVRVGPGHLFLGTQLDNINDMIAKGRDRHSKAKARRNK